MLDNSLDHHYHFFESKKGVYNPGEARQRPRDEMQREVLDLCAEIQTAAGRVGATALLVPAHYPDIALKN